LAAEWKDNGSMAYHRIAEITLPTTIGSGVMRLSGIDFERSRRGSVPPTQEEGTL